MSRLFLALSEMLKTFFFRTRVNKNGCKSNCRIQVNLSDEQKIQLTRTKADFGAADKSNSNALSIKV